MNADVDDFVATHGQYVKEAAERIYAARAALFQAEFDGYAADTLYRPSADEYLYWPAQRDDGWFIGYTSPCDDEQRVVDEMEERGFEYLGAGRNRLALACPEPYDDLVVKIGRCGTNKKNGAGRPHNLTEYRYTEEYGDEAPITPCLYCSPQGEYAVFPRIEATFEERPPEDDELPAKVSNELRAVLQREQEEDSPYKDENLGWLDGEPVVIDYFHAQRTEPMGVPDHVDGQAVIDRVHELRRQGEKMDLPANGVELIEPNLDD